MKNNGLGKIIKKLRSEKSMKQAQLAQILGKTTGTIGQFERGEIYPSYETLCKIIDFFDIDANLLFARENSRYSEEAVLISDLLGNMSVEDKKSIIKFHKDFARILCLAENNP